jgi:ATP-dependent RNA helicase DDX42
LVALLFAVVSLCRIAIGRTGSSSEHVDQHVMVLPSTEAKRQWLVEMLPVLAPLGRCIVFVATRADCDLLSSAVESSPVFRTGDFIIVSIHGDKDQSERNAAIAQFKKSPHAVMIATDVASRGLDIPDVLTVINFDAAKNIDSHVHRVGRAGRMSKSGEDDGSGEKYQQGVAYTLLTQQNADFAQLLAEAYEREGRVVTDELIALCQKSKRYGGGRNKQSKVGLGFGAAVGSAVQGTHTLSNPSAKNSRWG